MPDKENIVKGIAGFSLFFGVCSLVFSIGATIDYVNERTRIISYSDSSCYVTNSSLIQAKCDDQDTAKGCYYPLWNVSLLL